MFREVEIIELNRLEVTDSTAAAGLLRTRLASNAEVLLVAQHECVQWLPAISLALQTRMIRVVHYVIGHELPATFNSTWPDAPITFYGAETESLNLARLRGWETVNSETQPIEAVIAAIYSEI